MALTQLGQKWYRPALMILTKDEPTTTKADLGQWDIGSSNNAGTDYLFLTDDGRSDLQVTIQRIEYKKRMIDGRMRSYHIADKKSFNLSWTDLPSSASYISENNVADPSLAWGAGKEMVKWHENHPDSFYLMLVYDTHNPDGTPQSGKTIPTRYKIEYYNVFFENVSYNVKVRGPKYDLWDLNMSMVEV